MESGPGRGPGRHCADFGWSVGLPVHGRCGADHDEDAGSPYIHVEVQQKGPHRIRCGSS